MPKLLITLLLSIAVCAGLLSACEITASEKKEPTAEEKCIGIKRYIRYQSSNPNTEAAWRARSKRDDYYHEYHKLNCDEVLASQK